MANVTIRRIEEIDPYSGPHAIEGIRFRPARDALGVSAWGMNLLELDPHCEGYPQHDHAADQHEEVYVVLRGSVVLQVNGEEHTLTEGTLVRVAAELSRKLVTRAEGATILALGGTPGKAYSPSMG